MPQPQDQSDLRSNVEAREAIREALDDDPALSTADIGIAVIGGVATLTGTVREEQDKRRAEELSRRCRGVDTVVNQLRIGNPDAQTQGPVGEPGSGVLEGGRRNLGRA